MQLRALRDFRPLQHLLDEVDAPSRTVELIAEHLVGWAGRIAEPAVHAFAQDRLRVLAVAGLAEFRAQRSLHGGSEIGIESAGIENAVGIERLLEGSVNAHQRIRNPRERAR